MIPRARLKVESRRRPSEIFRKAEALPRRSGGSRIGDRTLIAVFVIMICLPLLGLVLGLDRGFVLEENRNLAVWPVLKLDRATLAALSSRFEVYFNDHFGFRKRLIYWLAIAKVHGLGVSSTSTVTLGSSGWLYFASESAVSSYRAARPFSTEQLEQYRCLLEARRDWLAARRNPLLDDHPAQQGHDISGIRDQVVQQAALSIAARPASGLHERAFQCIDP